MEAVERFDVAPRAGCEPLMGLMASMLEDATREWRGEMGDVPDEAVVWRPFEGGPSLGSVMWHMILVEGLWIEQVCAGRELSAQERRELRDAETDVDAGRWPEAEARPFADYLARQDEVRARTLATIATLVEPERFVRRREKWEFSVRWILNHVVGHESYHGGQLVLLKSLWERSAQ